MSYSTIVKGLELSRLLFEQVVKPIFDTNFPDFRYAAALIGEGSEVLGYDDDISKDHDWGPRLQIFYHLQDEDLLSHIRKILDLELPETVEGYTIRWDKSSKFDTDTYNPGPKTDHKILFYDLEKYLVKYLGSPNYPEQYTDWLKIPSQILLMFTAGEVFYDSRGELTSLRHRISFYPDSIRLSLIRKELSELGQNVAFTGRAGMVNDELGSRLIGTTQVETMIRIAFLLEKTYMPYPKWFGTGFSQLECARTLNPIFLNILSATTWEDREQFLCNAYIAFNHLFHKHGLIPKLDLAPQLYRGRPQTIVSFDEIWEGLNDTMEKQFPDLEESYIGTISMVTNVVEILERPSNYLHSDEFLVNH